MSHSSRIFEEAPIQVQKKNGFDLSHLTMGTSKCGQLMPVLCKLMPPNSDFTLGAAVAVELPPLATSFFGRVDAIVEGFVVPCSILYGGWKRFITNNPATALAQGQPAGVWELPTWDPAEVLSEGSSDFINLLDQDISGNNSLLDPFGYKIDLTSTAPDYGSHGITMLPFLAYHLIWDRFYRNKNVTKTVFPVNGNDSGIPASTITRNVGLVWHSFYRNGLFSILQDEESCLVFGDGTPIWRTRQRNYSRDYFTAATLSPQQGNASSLTFDVSGNSDDEGVVTASGGFTIAALRAANSLQKFLETNNLSQDYSDMMRNRWGTRPIDSDFDEPYYLGRVVIPVYQKSVYQQDSSSSGSAVNPFAQQGAIGVKGSHGSFTGEGSICGKFHNSTWAYVMCLFSLVPHAMYSQGINRELLIRFLGDFPAPEMQSVGNEEIFGSELFFDGSVVAGETDGSVYDAPDFTFGYIPRYSRFKYVDDSVHGELRPGRSLESFVLQRNFSSAPVLSTSFLEIKQDALDGVFAVSTAAMNLSCWFEIFFEFKAAMPLAAFCVPTLGELKDTKTIKAAVGGSRL